jgi:hypothetical protein
MVTELNVVPAKLVLAECAKCRLRKFALVELMMTAMAQLTAPIRIVPASLVRAELCVVRQ